MYADRRVRDVAWPHQRLGPGRLEQRDEPELARDPMRQARQAGSRARRVEKTTGPTRKSRNGVMPNRFTSRKKPLWSKRVPAISTESVAYTKAARNSQWIASKEGSEIVVNVENQGDMEAVVKQLHPSGDEHNHPVIFAKYADSGSRGRRALRTVRGGAHRPRRLPRPLSPSDPGRRSAAGSVRLGTTVATAAIWRFRKASTESQAKRGRPGGCVGTR
jgi:hypothetical protein